VSPAPVPLTGSLLHTAEILQAGAASQLSDAETATATGITLWFGGQRTFGLRVDWVLTHPLYCTLDWIHFSSYDHRMNKQAISVSLDPGNLLWLRAQAASSGCRSVSEMLDRMIREARTNGRMQDESIRSVVGTIRIAESDPSLCTADSAVRALFSAALGRRATSMPSRSRQKRGGGHRPVSEGRKYG